MALAPGLPPGVVGRGAEDAVNRDLVEQAATDRLNATYDAYARHILDAHARGKVYTADTVRLQTDFVAAGGAVFDTFTPTAAAHRAESFYGVLLQGFLAETFPSALTIDEVVWALGWHAAGRPTFVLTAGLLANLLLTDPGKVATDDVPWPFPAFRVLLPDAGGGGGPTIVDQGGSLLAVRALHALASRRSEGNIAGVRLTDPEFWRVAAQLPTTPLYGVRCYADSGLSVYTNQRWEGAVSDWLRSAGEIEGELEATDHRALALAQRLTVNLCLYLASEEDGTDRATWTPGAKTIGKGRTWEVGRAVRISKEVREAAASIVSGRASSAPSIRSIVRGHFRNQVCGKGRADRKRIYLKPFWRGPGEPTSTPREYKVGP